MTVQHSTNTAEKVNVTEPSRFKVIVHNDERTPFDFVIKLLKKIFHKTDSEAAADTQEVHDRGSAVVGIYFFEVAEEKSTTATNMAKANSFGLKVTFEPEI